MSSNAKSGSAGTAQDYYGSIAGVVACGPLDFISGVVIDDALVWPAAPEWPSGVRAVNTRRITPQVDRLSLQTADPHGCAVGDHVSLAGFPQPEWNVPYGRVTGANDPWGLQVAIPGVAVGATTDFTEGWVSRVAPIAAGELRRTGALVYESVTAHEATPETAPPNPAYWRQFRLSRTRAGVGNPLELSETGVNPSGGPMFKLTVESAGELFLYWGTPDQQLETVQENVLAPLGHPPYRDQIVVVLKDFFFGRERATPPNVRIIGGRKPVQSMITGLSAELDAEGQANPFCILAEWLTHPVWGLGFEPDQIDMPSWQAAADWAARRPDLLYLSPLLDRQSSARQATADLLAHVDGWLRWNPEGRLEAGHWPHDEPPPAFTERSTVDEDAAVEDRELEWVNDGWEGTTNQTVLTYPDAAHAFKNRPARASSPWNRTVRNRVAVRSIDRPHVTRASQALALAGRDAQINAQSAFSGSLTVRAETMGVRPGDPLRVRHRALGLEWLARCTERSIAAPPSARVTLEVAMERGWSALPARPYLPPPSAAGPLRAAPMVHFAFVVVPPLLADGDGRLGLLAARSNRLTSRLHVWMRQADPSAFYEVTSLVRFAASGTVTQSFGPYLDTSGNGIDDDDSRGVVLQIDELTPLEDVEQVLAVPTADAINDDSLLLFLLRAGPDAPLEICTVKSIAALGANHYRLTVRRAGFGTTQGGDGTSPWNPGDLAWVLLRSELTTFGHTQIPAWVTSGTPITFRLVPDSDWAPGDIADLLVPGDHPAGMVVETTVTLHDWYAPQVRWVGLTQGNAPVDFDAVHAPSETFVATLGFTDPQGGLLDADLTAVQGPVTRTWPIAGLIGAVGVLRQVIISGLTEGDWHLVVTLRTRTGRVLTALWPHGSTDAVLRVRSATSGVLLPPLAQPGGGSFAGFPVTVILSSSTPGADIEYWLAALGQNHAGDPLRYTAPLVVRANQTLWTRAVLRGPIYSQEISFDFTQPPRGSRYQPP